MNATTWIVLLMGGLAVLGAIIGAVVATVFQAGNAGRGALAVLLGLVGAGGGWWLFNHDIKPRLAYEAAAQAAEASPDVAALKQYYPTDYANMQQALEMQKGERKGAAGAQYLIRLTVNGVVTRQAKLGGDKQLVALMNLRRDEGQALVAKSPSYCTEYFSGGKLSFDPAGVLPADLLKRDAAVSADLLQQTAANPAKNAPGAEARDMSLASRTVLYEENLVRQAVLDKSLAQFPKEDQQTIKMMATRKTGLRDRPALAATMCRYKLAMLDETLKLPEAKAAMIYRMNHGTYF
jgi:hypothetical protein